MGLRGGKASGTKTIAVARAKLTESFAIELRAFAPAASDG